MKLILVSVLLFGFFGSGETASIYQRLYEARKTSHKICSTLQGQLEEISKNIKDNDAVGHDLHEHNGEAETLTINGVRISVSKSMQSTYQFVAAVNAADWCESTLNTFTAVIAQVRGMHACSNKDRNKRTNPIRRVPSYSLNLKTNKVKGKK